MVRCFDTVVAGKVGEKIESTGFGYTPWLLAGVGKVRMRLLQVPFSRAMARIRDLMRLSHQLEVVVNSWHCVML